MICGECGDDARSRCLACWSPICPKCRDKHLKKEGDWIIQNTTDYDNRMYD